MFNGDPPNGLDWVLTFGVRTDGAKVLLEVACPMDPMITLEFMLRKRAIIVQTDKAKRIWRQRGRGVRWGAWRLGVTRGSFPFRLLFHHSGEVRRSSINKSSSNLLHTKHYKGEKREMRRLVRDPGPVGEI